jgi:hypothetical protein
MQPLFLDIDDWDKSSKSGWRHARILIKLRILLSLQEPPPLSHMIMYEPLNFFFVVEF